ncbi:hypothetical protein QR680_006533 [Steinernema hermaphroditum]|uniref:RING-type domain-containing protein n=1 Tax=Steinernema hermaphroditum TaxID=289476 RepID=A0AA39HY94_9BILA|nr:hypothetical protein QR680_006533 [Steinernema hermaphroditum]
MSEEDIRVVRIGAGSDAEQQPQQQQQWPQPEWRSPQPERQWRQQGRQQPQQEQQWIQRGGLWFPPGWRWLQPGRQWPQPERYWPQPERQWPQPERQWPQQEWRWHQQMQQWSQQVQQWPQPERQWRPQERQWRPQHQQWPQQEQQQPEPEQWGDHWGQWDSDSDSANERHVFDDEDVRRYYLNEAEISQVPMTMVTSEQTEKQCTTCMDHLNEGVEVARLDCAHLFHLDCIVPWLRLHNTCPVCRATVDPLEWADNEMSSIGTGYDLAASTFSPDGRIFQIEYAQKHVDSSLSVMALRGKDGILLIADKPMVSKLNLATANRRIGTVDDFIGFASSGLYPDAVALLDYAIEESLKYKKDYSASIPIKELSRSLAEYMHYFTLGVHRPFGASVFFTRWTEKEGGKIYVVEPSGMSKELRGWALGQHNNQLKVDIENLRESHSKMNFDQLVKEAARMIIACRDGMKDADNRMEMVWCGADTGGKAVTVPSETVESAVSWAVKKLEEEDAMETQ